MIKDVLHQMVCQLFSSGGYSVLRYVDLKVVCVDYVWYPNYIVALPLEVAAYGVNLSCECGFLIVFWHN